ncbi:helix-turn-helix domain-containing protein [Hydrocarboniclastica marina]|uniref:Helix-turn-helix domain-containing protein n=1 Tax=Hydrocarboniclastica marina TaxID=2259620 RepID=A0A4P7XKQ9_9ALTE|nr:helix-turn-helix domain-containing protein [Hydrocarboniclastica marina]MAM00101.1 hypothetical protein [Alteromonadaceae bacterium]QCF27413.1 hypothetical protein soil367_16590 [Hydrocarboniclastica marina]|tara:strand:- start:2144 stop:2485 length:342 start_codon:yes stop_codon:yes gene_type:complete
MSPITAEGLSLQEAATLVGRTTKTLYRWMDKGLLSYLLSEAGRRLIDQSELLKVATRSTGARARSRDNNAIIIKMLIDLEGRLERQEALMIGLVELYQPGSIDALNRKRQLLR